MTADLERTPPPAWTPAELDAIREGLDAAVVRIGAEILSLDGAISGTSTGNEALHDDLDVATQRAELLQDAVQVQNLTAILEQTKHVLARLTAGLYGVCETCAGEIARPRLEAFPRATACMTCAH